MSPQIYCWSCNGERQTRRLREQYVNSILRQEVGWFDSHAAGELSSRVQDLCGQVPHPSIARRPALTTAVLSYQVQDGIGRKFGDMEQYFVQVSAFSRGVPVLCVCCVW